MSDYTKLRDLIKVCEGKYSKVVCNDVKVCYIIPYNKLNHARCEFQGVLYNLKRDDCDVPLYTCLKVKK